MVYDGCMADLVDMVLLLCRCTHLGDILIALWGLLSNQLFCSHSDGHSPALTELHDLNRQYTHDLLSTSTLE